LSRGKKIPKSHNLFVLPCSPPPHGRCVSFHWSRKMFHRWRPRILPLEAGRGSLGAAAPPSVGSGRGRAEGSPRWLRRVLPPEPEDALSSVDSGFRHTRDMESQWNRGSLPTSSASSESSSRPSTPAKARPVCCRSLPSHPPHLNHVLFPRCLH
jgi:hypothetical protein